MKKETLLMDMESALRIAAIMEAEQLKSRAAREAALEAAQRDWALRQAIAGGQGVKGAGEAPAGPAEAVSPMPLPADAIPPAKPADDDLAPYRLDGLAAVPDPLMPIMESVPGYELITPSEFLKPMTREERDRVRARIVGSTPTRAGGEEPESRYAKIIETQAAASANLPNKDAWNAIYKSLRKLYGPTEANWVRGRVWKRRAEIVRAMKNAVRERAQKG